MTRPGLMVLICLCAFLIQYNGDGVRAAYSPNNDKVNKPSGCGCLYNLYANLPMEERAKRACSVSCLYSTLGGRCNNICHAEWGEQGLPFGRLLNPDYCTAKGHDATRCAKSNNPLPSARKLSVDLFQDRPATGVLDKFLTSAHMAFGQFLSHDFGKRKAPKESDDVCGRNQCKMNAECTPIQVPTGDPAFTPSPTMCLRLQRSIRNDAPNHDSKEQTNLASSYVDLSTVYGDTVEAMELVRDVRTEYRAYLNTTDYSQINLGPGVREGKPLLPQMGAGDCRGQTDKIKCFLGGDTRVKDQPQMALYHTIFMREHNRIAQALDQVNGGCWSQDRLFLEARKINYAQFQYMTYNEYLPLLLSEKNLKFWKLKLAHSGFTNSYDNCVNSTVANVFMTASFRFGHTQIPEEVPVAENHFGIYKKPKFGDHFNSPELVYDVQNAAVTAIDAICFGMVAFPAEASDTFVNKEVTERFDVPPQNTVGRDLLAIDIARGRDHGLPGYNAWLEFCGFGKAATFNDFSLIPAKHRTELAALYEHVDDVDVFVAAMLETPKPGDLSGPTFSCLNANQFHRARFGDRFWHEEKSNGFTKAQLQNIRQITSGKLFCENLDNAVYMQPNTLAHPRSVAAQLTDAASTWDFTLVYDEKLGSDNERVRCTDLPGLDFNLWKETGCFNPNCDKKYPRNK